MQYEVPQFIDIKDKIVGPLTLPQFLFMGGGIGGAYAAYRFLFLPINIILAIFLIILGSALAFYQYNGRPFPVMLQAMLAYAGKKKLYIWKFRDEVKLQKFVVTNNVEQSHANVSTQPMPKPKPKPEPVVPEKVTSRQKLQDIAWGLDVLDKR
jgi:uncharacterized membrane protein required for colicin V production